MDGRIQSAWIENFGYTMKVSSNFCDLSPPHHPWTYSQQMGLWLLIYSKWRLVTYGKSKAAPVLFNKGSHGGIPKLVSTPIANVLHINHKTKRAKLTSIDLIFVLFDILCDVEEMNLVSLRQTIHSVCTSVHFLPLFAMLIRCMPCELKRWEKK